MCHVSIKFTDDGPNHHTANPSRICSKLVEDISGCLLGKEDDGSDLAKYTISLNCVLQGSLFQKVWDIVRDVLNPWSTELLITITQPTIVQPTDIATSSTQCALYLSLWVYPHSRRINLQ